MAMSQVGYVTLTGYVTAEPKMWHTARTQTPVAKVRVGSTPRRLDRQTGEWQDGETSYYTVKCWRKLAENVTGCLRKGDMVIVRGKVRTRTWVDDQQRTRSEVEIEADSVGHDLAFGWSHFNRGVHVPPGAARRMANGEMARQGMAPDADLPDDAPFPGEFDDYEDAPSDLPGDDGSDGPGIRLAPGAPDGPLTSQDAPRYTERSESSGDERAFAELTRDIDQPTETAAPF
jgi:single-strand DNA-binding protein